MQKRKSRTASVRAIPEYRAEIDVSKICKALILAAKLKSDAEAEYREKIPEKSSK